MTSSCQRAREQNCPGPDESLHPRFGRSEPKTDSVRVQLRRKGFVCLFGVGEAERSSSTFS